MEISPLYYAGRAVTTLLRWLFLLAVAFIILYPLVYMLSMAFRSPKDFMDVTVIWIPKTPTLDNFKTAIGRVGMLRAMGYTVYISTVSSILQIFVTCLAGYGFARFRFKGNARFICDGDPDDYCATADAGHAQLSANEEFRFFWPLRPA